MTASSEWKERKAQEDQDRALNFTRLTDLAIRVDGYRRRAEASAQVVAGMENGNTAALQQEATDMQRLADFVAWYAARLDRLHLLEEPAPHPTSGYGGKRKAVA